MHPLKNKIALVTGATKQVGRGVAIGLAEAGAKVYVTGRHLTHRRYGEKNPWGTLTQTVKEVEEVGGTAIPIVCDHTDDKQTRAVFDQIEQEEGQLDILVNGVWAGYDKMRADRDNYPWESDFWDQPAELWDDMFLGVRASYIANSMTAPFMVKQKSGLIVNITWFVGRLYSENVAYDVSHAALDRMAADMAIELKPHNVATISLSPMGIVEDTQWNVKEAESARFIGRIVTQLYNDKDLMSKSGQILGTRVLGKHYGITDDNGKLPPIIRRDRLKTAYPEWQL